MLLILVHPQTKKIKRFEIGWSWTCFFFYYLGIPLFNRLLFLHGFLMIAVWLIMLSTRTLLFSTLCDKGQCLTVYYSDIILFLMFFASIFYALKANEMGIKNYVARGWEVDNASDEEARRWLQNEQANA